MVERAGYGWLKYSAITALTSANWPRLVRYRPTRATSSSEPPAASQTALRLSNARRACAAMSPATSSPELGRASGRERVCQDVLISVGAGCLKQQNKAHKAIK